ncbi:MAG: hypothetical protein KKG33_11325 [candidate division Zixibacteria bacterium]|nr:hypothetical protein [candidate division Zixibacteria bacterium]
MAAIAGAQLPRALEFRWFVIAGAVYSHRARREIVRWMENDYDDTEIDSG